ncbi:MAG: ABC transporter ATP-binding protein [Lachnospiraceae bacterium]|jgi:putative ABC transport system ATP-binding protein|nr:ABC transporter ATP-binding protein [Lachnospiraceae bacterium]
MKFKKKVHSRKPPYGIIFTKADEKQNVRGDKMEYPPVMIRVKNLYKIYKVGESKVRALNGVDFTLYKGEFCAIVGTSGSGKSTLLNMLAGLEKPTKGEIEIAGKRIEKLSEKELVTFRREKVGFIFQSYNLLNTMNAIENVALPLSFRGMKRKDRLARAKKYMDLVGVGKQANHMPNQMSGGQQQRVGIARALAVNPQIIFADEPTGNLDSKTTMEVLKLMQKIVRDQKQTLVMVTHDNNLASYADRRIRIIDGKIVSIEEGAIEAGEENGNQGGMAT